MADVLKVPEVAERLRMDVKYVRKMIASGELPALRSGRVVRVAASALDRLLGADGEPNREGQ